jgi:alkylated DNA repair dioxygenase AlkB
MKPTYYDKMFNYDLEHFLKLEWLEATETRKEYFMSDIPRKYSYGKGRGVREYTSNPYSPEVSRIQTFLNGIYHSEYNVCFLNRYDTQKNHLGWHADDFVGMDQSHPIAVVSFGAEREIWWKKKDYKGIIPQENRQLLEDGSLFIMPGGFQDDYYHKIPKCDKDCGIRISLTFRKIS